MLLALDEDGELTLQDVERVHVLPVDVRSRSGPRAVVPRFRDAELSNAALITILPPNTAHALPGATNNRSHGASMTIPAAR